MNKNALGRKNTDKLEQGVSDLKACFLEKIYFCFIVIVDEII